jgi:hypothetical protein
MERKMNFFGIEITDLQFEAAMDAARADPDPWSFSAWTAVAKALGFEAGDTAKQTAASPPPFSQPYLGHPWW